MAAPNPARTIPTAVDMCCLGRNDGEPAGGEESRIDHCPDARGRVHQDQRVPGQGFHINPLQVRKRMTSG